MRSRFLVPFFSLASAVLATAATAANPATPSALALANRVTWGASAANPLPDGDRWLETQLRMSADVPLPRAAQVQIDAMRIVREPVAAIVAQLDAQNRTSNAVVDTDAKKLARDAYNNAINAVAREAATRSLLRDLYSPAQLREQLTWFWFNQFNVQAGKRDIRTLVGDYEDRAIRPHALGRFRDLLEATLSHPAMLRYLDNDQNAANHINENYAREIMELHSMGVGSGYTQKDVQELARILTGVGVNLRPDTPRLKPEWQRTYVRAGLFEFNPARHDFGDKEFLGQHIRGQGFGEVEQALDLIAASPATAHHVSERLATYFLGDAPPAPVVDRMAASFRSSRGDTAAVLRTLFRSPEFKASLAPGASAYPFKDPVHYVVSAVRLAYGDSVILNAQPMLNWLGRMGEGLYAHETPDGYPLTSAAWTGPGQLAVRFEIARQIGSGSAGLFKAEAPDAVDRPAFPQLQNALYYEVIAPTLSGRTRAVLAQANSPQDWNALFLSSPDFMRR